MLSGCSAGGEERRRGRLWALSLSVSLPKNVPSELDDTYRHKTISVWATSHSNGFFAVAACVYARMCVHSV